MTVDVNAWSQAATLCLKILGILIVPFVAFLAKDKSALGKLLQAVPAIVDTVEQERRLAAAGKPPTTPAEAAARALAAADPAKRAMQLAEERNGGKLSSTMAAAVAQEVKARVEQLRAAGVKVTPLAPAPAKP